MSQGYVSLQNQNYLGRTTAPAAPAAAKAPVKPKPTAAAPVMNESSRYEAPPAAPQGAALSGLQAAAAPSTASFGGSSAPDMDAIDGGVGGPLRQDLGQRTPPSLAALLQGLRY